MDVLHNDSVRGKLYAMRKGGELYFPITRMMYVRNVVSTLNAMTFGKHRWSSKLDKEKRKIKVTKVF